MSVMHRFIKWHNDFRERLGCEPTGHQAYKAGFIAAVKAMNEKQKAQVKTG